VDSIFRTVATIKYTFSFIKKTRIPRSLVWSTYFIGYQQSIVKLNNYSRFKKNSIVKEFLT